MNKHSFLGLILPYLFVIFLSSCDALVESKQQTTITLEPTITAITELTSTPTPRSYNVQTVSMEFNDWERKNLVMVPDDYSEEEDYPLVIYLHSSGNNPQKAMRNVDINWIGNDNGFIIAYPAARPNWNSGKGDNSSSRLPDNDDVLYISNLIDLMNEEYSIDLSRVYATGWSNGAFMAYKLACQLSDRIAAVASVGGLLSSSTLEECNPTRPVSILEIHGTKDGWVSYDGEEGWHSVDETIEYWVEINQCKIAEMSSIPDLDTNDGSTVEKITYHDCLDNSEVVLYKVIGGGNTWPDMPKDFGFGKINRDINGGVVIWEFFEQHTISEHRE